MLERLNTALDLYCERTGPEFWSEPVNALTNLVFIVVGLWAARAARRAQAGVFAETLAWMIVAIGVGSTLFHTFANELTKWADILPIGMATLAFSLYHLRRFAGFGWPLTLAVFIAYYVVAGFLTWAVPDWLRVASNGSTGYLAPSLGLLVFGVIVLAKGNRIGWWNFVAAGLFCVAVTFRALDPAVCEGFPLGTHFLWHLVNDALFGVLLHAVVLDARDRPVGTGKRPGR